MTTRCDVCKLIRTLSTVISTMYLTPSIIDGILRASFTTIVHPTISGAQITTMFYYANHPHWIFIFLPHEYNKRNVPFQVLTVKNPMMVNLSACAQEQFELL